MKDILIIAGIEKMQAMEDRLELERQRSLTPRRSLIPPLPHIPAVEERPLGGAVRVKVPLPELPKLPTTMPSDYGVVTPSAATTPAAPVIDEDHPAVKKCRKSFKSWAGFIEESLDDKERIAHLKIIRDDINIRCGNEADAQAVYDSFIGLLALRRDAKKVLE